MSTDIMSTNNSKKSFTQEITGTVSEIINQVKKLIKEGNARRVIIQNKDGKVLFQSQLTVGIGGMTILTAIAPIVSAISMFALMLNDIKIIVERYPDEDVDNYEVEADFIEIREEDEEADETEGKETNKEGEDKTDKTVGKNNDGE